MFIGANLRKLVAAARTIVTHQVGLPVGCIRLNKILTFV